jgi:hypothetical protein
MVRELLLSVTNRHYNYESNDSTNVYHIDPITPKEGEEFVIADPTDLNKGFKVLTYKSGQWDNWDAKQLSTIFNCYPNNRAGWIMAAIEANKIRSIIRGKDY